MTTTVKFKMVFQRLLIATFFLIASSGRTASGNKYPEVGDFKITISKTDTGITLHSHHGSAWIDLSFSLVKHKPQAIDEYGMTQLDNVSKLKDSELADFLFTITLTDNGVKLKGVEGTSWTNLSFSLSENKKQAIDQDGMVEND